MKSQFTFAICAYKNSPYLEETVLSAKQQTVPVEILIATSTPSKYIENIAKKYNVPYFVNPNRGNIASDWNFAISQIKTPYGTIMHQDDIYFSRYAESVILKFSKYPKSLIAFTDYGDLMSDGKVHVNRYYLWIKRLLLWAFYLKHTHKSVWCKNTSIIFGNAICCPAVSYNLDFLKRVEFDSSYSVNLDWAMWLTLAKRDGRFIFIPKVLMAHRIVNSMETAIAIADNRRFQEDLRIFTSIWGKTIGSVLMKFYKKAYSGNKKS